MASKIERLYPSTYAESCGKICYRLLLYSPNTDNMSVEFDLPSSFSLCRKVPRTHPLSSAIVEPSWKKVLIFEAFSQGLHLFLLIPWSPCPGIIAHFSRRRNLDTKIFLPIIPKKQACLYTRHHYGSISRQVPL